MKLLVISHTPHYTAHDQIVGWGPTVRELDYLSTLFDQVVHIAPLYPENAPSSALAYQSHNIRFCPVQPAGGSNLLDKVGILSKAPNYIRTIVHELPQADIVHIRCPANISLIALMVVSLSRHPRSRWIKYAGNWRPEDGEPVSYSLQRWWLKHNLAQAKVTVNGEWPNEPSYIHSFLNPCLTESELAEGRVAAGTKRISLPLRLLFVGNLNTSKGVGRALEIVGLLRTRNLDVQFDIVGDGQERPAFEAQANALKIRNLVHFHGWMPRDSLGTLYAGAHFMLMPTNSEGWPKALSEGMAYGVVPIAGAISSIPQYLSKFQTGKAVAPDDIVSFANVITGYASEPDRWLLEKQNALSMASLFTYNHYLEQVRDLLGIK